MRPNPALPVTALALAAALAVAGCSSINESLSGDKIDYRSGATKTPGLEVPPDLTQLAREGRYQPPAAVVSAAAGASAPRGSAAADPTASVAPLSAGELRIVRDGQQRWLVAPATPEQLWPQVKAFWVERGFSIEFEDAAAGVIETGWAENRAKLPQDGIRAVIGRVFDKLYDTGERDRFRTRIERGAAGGSEIHVTHRGLSEEFTNDQKDQTRWVPRPPDPDLEAEFTARLMMRLGAPEQVARTALAQPETRPAQARAVTGHASPALEIDDGFDRAWRRVGVALDRTGFTVEDRNRADGLYYVRYVDRDAAAKEQGFFARLFGGSDEAAAAQRFRLALKAPNATQTVLLVQAADGSAAGGPAAQRIADVLLAELR